MKYNSGCKNCPAFAKCIVTYRSSACAALRYTYGLDNDPMTNADHIRTMTDEELCEFLYLYKFCDMCEEGCAECHYHGDCERRLADWLKQPYKEG